MNPKEQTTTQKKKLTYEELENACHQLSEQARKMYMQLQEADKFNLFKRLDYLFKVLENATMFSEDFVPKCADEIEEILTIPEDTSDPTDTSKDTETIE